MFGKLNHAEIEQVLSKQVFGRLGCHANGVTYIVPLSYAYDGSFLYAHSREGMKVDIMRQNPDVCFQVDTMENMANWKSVVLWGRYEELEDGAARKEALKKLSGRLLPIVSSVTTHLSAEWPFPDTNMSAVAGVVFRIRIVDKTGRYEDSTPESINEWLL